MPKVVEPQIPNYPPQGIQAQLDLLYLWNPDAANELIKQLEELIKEAQETNLDYNKLVNKPTLDTTSTNALVAGTEEIAGAVKLHKVSKTGSYEDLKDQPDLDLYATKTALAAGLGSKADLTTVNTMRTDLDDLGDQVHEIEAKVPGNASASNQLATKADVSGLETSLANVAKTGSYNDLGDKPTIGNAVLTITRNNESAGSFTANATENKTINITVPVSAGDVSALPDSTKYGASVSLTMDSTTYKVSASLKDQNGDVLGAVQTIDLPLESVVVSGTYDATTKEVVLTLQDGSEIRFSVADLVDGLQTEITEANKLSADLVDDSTTVNKFVTATEKTTWSGKQDAISDLATIRDGASKGATAVQPADLAKVATSGSYADLSNKPTIPTVNNPTITITQGGVTKGSFTLNQATDDTIALDAGGSSSADNNGLEGDYCCKYGIVDETISGLPTQGTGNQIIIPAQLVMDVPGVSGLTTNATAITHDLVSTTDCEIFLAQGTAIEATEVYWQTTEPEDGQAGYLAWWNGMGWKFKSNDTGNVWRAANAVRIAKCIFTDGNLTRLCFTGCRVLNKQEWLPKSGGTLTGPIIAPERASASYASVDALQLRADTDSATGTPVVIQVSPAASISFTGTNFYFSAPIVPTLAGRIDLGSAFVKWRCIYATKLNNGADIAVPTTGGTMALVEDITPIKDHSVIEFQAPTAENNYTWYRKYADGWVEQGGIATSAPTTERWTSKQVSFPVEMADTNYVALGTAYGLDSVSTIICCIGGINSNNQDNGTGKTTTGMLLQGERLYTTTESRVTKWQWQVSGMAA